MRVSCYCTFIISSDLICAPFLGSNSSSDPFISIIHSRKVAVTYFVITVQKFKLSSLEYPLWMPISMTLSPYLK